MQENISETIRKSNNFVIVTDRSLDLREENTVFILFAEGAQAGGRVSSLGSRSITRVVCYSIKKDGETKIAEITDSRAAQFQVPSFVALMPVTLGDGSEHVAYCAIDSEIVKEFLRLAGIQK